MSNIIEEFKITHFDEYNHLILRVFDNNMAYLIFDEFPPKETSLLPSNQINNLDMILSNLTGVDIIQDDRELFIIMSNDKIVLGKIISYFK